MRKIYIVLFSMALVICAGASEPDYQVLYDAAYPVVANPVPLEEYATSQRFNDLYLKEGWKNGYENLSNDTGGMAWGTSYFMMALNNMIAATRGFDYLEASAFVLEQCLAATDAKRGKTLSDGRSVAAWGSEGYSEGRAVHVVHTGIIAAPMLQWAIHARAHGRHMELADRVVRECVSALQVHDAQWRDGPEEDTGHYVGLGMEKGFEGMPLPGNWQSAIGWAWWNAGVADNNDQWKERARKLGRYIKYRLSPAPDGALYWPYTLPIDIAKPATREAIQGEDTSHAGLTMSLPFVLAQAGDTFDEATMRGIAGTVIFGFAPTTDGVLCSSVTGGKTLDPASYISFPSRWIWLSRYRPEVADHLLPFYQNRRETPSPLELSDLVLWRTQREL